MNSRCIPCTPQSTLSFAPDALASTPGIATQSPLQRWAFTVAALLVFNISATRADQIDIAGPPGSVNFGSSVLVLPNGNLVVTDPDAPPMGAGAVFLYAPDGTLISNLRGSQANDHVGLGVLALKNGNFLVFSFRWNNGTAANAGAVTWVSGETGLSGVVSAENSLVGSSANDQVGVHGFTELHNGNYVVASSEWNNGSIAKVGAVTWADGSRGVSGVVAASNSQVGTARDDRVGASGVTALANGHYVVGSPLWDNGAVADVGAVTWVNGSTGATGAVSLANSLVGTATRDQVGGGGIAALSNGHYVVNSSGWHIGNAEYVGAVTWGNGDVGTRGVVSADNSLIGSTLHDQVGFPGATPLTNGNYVVQSFAWNNGAALRAGAVTWCRGDGPTSAIVSPINSLVGTTTDDAVGRAAIALTNGNFVIGSHDWSNAGALQVGAVTWGSGTSGIAGTINAGNSQVGSAARDNVGFFVTALSNGNYVSNNSAWNERRGAVTWGNGTTGSTGVVSAANSLVGSTPGDRVGYDRAIALSNGNYVFASPLWHNGPVNEAGAVTWADGNQASAGEVSASNSLVGTREHDQVGFVHPVALSNGNYVVPSIRWNNGISLPFAGAVTWGNGRNGTRGAVSASNSLVGTHQADQIGNGGVFAFADSSVVVGSPFWIHGGINNAGAVTLASGGAIPTGPITSQNSLLGLESHDVSNNATGPTYDPIRSRLVVGRPQRNQVTMVKFDSRPHMPSGPPARRLRCAGGVAPVAGALPCRDFPW